VFELLILFAHARPTPALQLPLQHHKTALQHKQNYKEKVHIILNKTRTMLSPDLGVQFTRGQIELKYCKF